MQIEVFQNNRAVRPQTVWRSMADMYNYLEENKSIASLCEKIKETGDKAFKQQLPAMMPMGNIGDKTRKKENCVPTGLVMVDIDKTLSPNPLPSSERALSSVAPDSATFSCPVSPLATPKGGGSAMRGVSMEDGRWKMDDVRWMMYDVSFSIMHYEL